MLNTRPYALAGHLRPNEGLIDIGHGDGQLGLWAYRHKNCRPVKLIDQSLIIYHHSLEKWGDLKDIEIHCGRGEDVELEDSGGNVVLAGMGSATMIKVLRQLLPQKNARLYRFLLCSHTDQIVLRGFLKNTFLNLVDEFVVLERHLYRTILILEEHGVPICEFGSVMWENPCKTHLNFARYQSNKWKEEGRYDPAKNELNDQFISHLKNFGIDSSLVNFCHL